MKRALIFGINGQDGSFLAELLLSKGYSVHGLYRRSSADNLWRIRHMLDRITLYKGDITDTASVQRTISACLPLDFIFNEADQDQVDWSHDVPEQSVAVTYGGAANILEAVWQLCPEVKVFQPVSATMFGQSLAPQNETTPLDPRSPYACAKAASLYLARHYRWTHGMYVSTGILFNHHSSRRKHGYLLDKLAKSVLDVADGVSPKLRMGNLDLRVDIGHAAEYVKGIWDLMQLDEPADVVLATGRGIPIRTLALEGLQLVGADVRAIDTNDGYTRPGSEPELIGDTTLAKSLIGWNPQQDALSILKDLIAEARYEL